MKRLRIEAGAVRLEVELRDTATARAILAAAPFESRAQTWGEEVYFAAPVAASLEPDAEQVVEPGTVCFWTEGRAIALPFGRTPISTDERPKLAARCNLVGRIAGDFSALAKVRAGDPVRVSEA
ncbi:MAG: hypothetical protein N2653_11250 [Burkholderiales bacterium]|nr:hypothetical protein [Burkholderiales bacterium]